MTINLDQYTNTLNVTDTATNADLNVTTKGTGAVNLNTGTGTQVKIKDSGATTVNFLTLFGGGTGTGITYQPEGTDSNITLDFISKGTGVYRFATGSFSQRQFQIAHTASAVNYVQVTGSVTGGLPAISAQGSDSNVSLLLKSKGTANTVIQNESATFFQNLSGASQFRAASTASAVNYLSATGSIASSSPVLSAVGSDTNIDLAFTPKGTGNVRFGTHTGTADTAVSGYIEIKDSGGTVRKLAVIT